MSNIFTDGPDGSFEWHDETWAQRWERLKHPCLGGCGKELVILRCGKCQREFDQKEAEQRYQAYLTSPEYLARIARREEREWLRQGRSTMNQVKKLLRPVP